MTRNLRLTAAMIACAVSSPALLAGDDYPYPFWTDRDGVWSNGASWSTGAAPTSSIALINNGATVTLDTDIALSSFAVGYDGVGLGINPFSMPAGFVHPVGIHAELSNDLLLGDRGVHDGPSTYSLRGTLDAPGVRVGLRGNGLLSVLDGGVLQTEVLRIAPILEIGNTGLGKGAVEIDGVGTAVSIETLLDIGERGEASFKLSGGATLDAAYASFNSSTTEPTIVHITGAGTELVSTRNPANFVNGIGLGATPFPVIPEDEIAPVIMTIDDGAIVRAEAGNDDAVFLLGGPSVLRGDGTVQMPTIEFFGGGRIAPGGDAVGSLTLDGINEWGARASDPPAVFAVRIGDEQNDHVIVRSLSLGEADFQRDQVTLEVLLHAGHVPLFQDRHEIITITDQAGVYGIDAEDKLGFFTTLDLPDLGPELIIRPVYYTNRIELRVTCPADIDANWQLNLNDLQEFVDHILEGNPVADLTLDGVFNFDDIDLFVESFLNGC